MKKIIINARGREKRWLLAEDNVVSRLEVHQPAEHSKVGNVYVGVVESIKPSLNAAFVSFDKGKNGFLSFKDVPSHQTVQSIQSLLHQGQRILVQVKKDESSMKGAVLTANLECGSRSLVYFPFGRIVTVSKKILESAKRNELKDWGNLILKEQEGLLLRTEAKEKSLEKLQEELESLRRTVTGWQQALIKKKAPSPVEVLDPFVKSLYTLMEKERSGLILTDEQTIKEEIQTFLSNREELDWQVDFEHADTDIFSRNGFSGIEEKATKNVVWLNGGISIVIEATEALTVIDVNSGKLAKQGQVRQSIRKINEAAGKEIARQLKLRDISGIIIVDFINMSSSQDQQFIENMMKRLCQHDHKHVEVVGFTSLSLLQLTRKKTRPSLEESLFVRCPVCDGKGLVASAETLAFRLERELFEHRRSIRDCIQIEATKDVMDMFRGEGGQFQAHIENQMGTSIEWVSAGHQHPFYHILRL
ncbi:ribonuclease E/G [Jeotgalibacillus soli]|nr:ribonuclease E/G [Jeotgalibacillus soli]